MRKMFQLFIVLLSIFFLSGCGSKNPVKDPDLPTTKQLQFDKIEFVFNEPYQTKKIIYHTSIELEDMLNKKILEKLKEKSLYSENKNDDLLHIEATYMRGYLGHATPLKTESLGSPYLQYTITITDKKSKVLRYFQSGMLFVNRGLFGNLEGMFGGMRDKKYEVEFIEAFANLITEATQILTE